MSSSRSLLGVLFLLGLSSNTVFADHASCTQPIDQVSPYVTVFAPDLRSLAKDGEAIRYSYVISVQGQTGYGQTITLSNANIPGSLADPTTSKIPVGAFLSQENGESFVNVTVRLVGYFSPQGSGGPTQKFDASQTYRVKTAGLCLESDPLPISTFTVNLPTVGIFKRYYRLSMGKPNAPFGTSLNLNPAKAFNETTNQISFSFLGRPDPAAEVIIEALFSANQDRGMVTIPLAQFTDRHIETTITADQFVIIP